MRKRFGKKKEKNLKKKQRSGNVDHKNSRQIHSPRSSRDLAHVAGTSL